MFKKVLLVVWIIIMVIPAAWLFSADPDVNRLFNDVFYPERMHILAHLVGFAVLAGLLQLMLTGKAPGWTALLLILVVAAGQEAFQLIYKGRLPGSPELFDLAIDLIGSAIGWFGMLGIRRLIRKTHPVRGG